MKISVRKSEIEEVKNNLTSGVSYGNHNFSFIYRPAEGLRTKHDWTRDGKIKFFNNDISFFRAIVRFTKTGY